MAEPRAEVESSATLLPRSVGPGANPAMLRVTPGETVIRDGRGRTTTLRHHDDVERFVLRRTPSRHGGVVWTLDLMHDETCRARLHAPPWDFDRTYGPDQLAAVSGLPLVQRATKLDQEPSPVSPGTTTKLSGPLLPIGYLAMACYLLLVLIGDTSNWLVPPLAVMVAVLVAHRVRPLLRSRGRTIAGPHPAGPVQRGFARRARVEEVGGLLRIRTHVFVRDLPPSHDACGPTQLRPARLEDGRSTSTTGSGQPDALVLSTTSGHTLATLPWSDWVAGRPGSERELAEAMGVHYDPEPVTGVHAIDAPVVSTGASAALDDRAFVVGLPGALSLLGLAAGDVDGLVALGGALGAVAVLLGPLWELAVVARSWWWTRDVQP